MSDKLYNSSGVELNVGGGGEPVVGAAINYDTTLKSVAHRGLSSAAPENTIPAYRAAAAAGFHYVETDVQFTSDGVPVLLHNNRIDDTSNGVGEIVYMTYETVRTYDFGSWFSADFTGTQIPNFDEFIVFCKQAMLHPYIELKFSAFGYSSASTTKIQMIVDKVEAAGMKGKVTYISFKDFYLSAVKDIDPDARLGLLFDCNSSGHFTDALITSASGLKTNTNEVFLDARGVNSTDIGMCKTAHIPLEVWIVDSASGVRGLDPYITGMTTNTLIGGKVLYDDALEDD